MQSPETHEGTDALAPNQSPQQTSNIIIIIIKSTHNKNIIKDNFKNFVNSNKIIRKRTFAIMGRLLDITLYLYLYFDLFLLEINSKVKKKTNSLYPSLDQQSSALQTCTSK